MAYIGNDPSNRFVAPKAASVFSGDGSTTAFTLDHAVGSDEDILVSVDGVIQEPSVAYAVSNGTTLTFTGAPSSNSGNNIFVYYLFRTVGTVSHPSNNALSATTGTFSGAISAASLDADGGVTVDNITIDGTEIDLSSGDLTVDVAGTINLDSDTGSVNLVDGGTTYGELINSSSDFVIKSSVSDKDLIFKGNDGGSLITAMTIDMSAGGKVGIGTTLPSTLLHLRGADATDTLTVGNTTENTALTISTSQDDKAVISATDGGTARSMVFVTGTSEKMRIQDNGNFLIGTTNQSPAEGTTTGTRIGGNGRSQFSADGDYAIYANRVQDGAVIAIASAGTVEGSINVSGTTVSFNGGHLSRWSRLLNNSKDETIVKGTVMTNLDEMIEWTHEKELWTKDDELPDGVSVGDVKKDAYIEDNEQLNKMAVSSVEGDVNVAGVFVNWDNDDDWNDMNVAMTGDMVIRIAKGTKVARGDLLMSAGDGTAKPQDDDIVRSKTIAKVTSTNVSHTYDDGTYLVPCVLMAC